MKRGIRTTAICLLTFLPLTLLSAGDNKPKTNEKGIGIVLTNSGFGAGGFYHKRRSVATLFTFDFEIININGKDEMTIVQPDYYGRPIQYKFRDKKLLLIPVSFGIKKQLWTDQIADNFQPYVGLSFGPSIALDLPEDTGFIDQFKLLQAHYTLGLRFNVGADIENASGSFIVINVGYNYIRYAEEIDERKRFGGFGIRLGFGKWF